MAETRRSRAPKILNVVVLPSGEATRVEYDQVVYTDGTGDGYALEADSVAVAISASQAAGRSVFLTHAAIYVGAETTLAYTASAGSVTNHVTAAGDYPATLTANFSAEPEPAPSYADSAGYALDDDGTLATAFGSTRLPTDTTNYHIVEYTFTGTGNPMALPSALTDAVVVGAGVKFAVEMVVHSVPATGAFGQLELVAAEVDGSNVPTGVVWEAQVYDASGDGADYSGLATTATALTSPVEGFRVGLIFNGDTGAVTGVTTDGALTVSATAFTPGNKILPLLRVNDDAGTGNVAKFQIVPNAADMGLVYPAGTTDWNGQACPTA